ncbi:MAG TPA: peptidylprolyl isomerase [Candidatus Polarisedimenticolia bacterium]|jgi:peptidyl-prolyl cis-trans isomerase C|nr:peptidylprolyl isomerase [Candidatus Polarisedimenticolia bacterium]
MPSPLRRSLLFGSARAVRVPALLGLLLLACAPGLAAPGAGEAPADSVARVNGRPILRRDFEAAVQLQFRGRRPGRDGLKELQSVREKVLEQLIENELLYQKASKADAAVPEERIEAEFKTLRDGFPSASEFADVLKETGVTEAEIKEQLRRTLIVTRFVDREVLSGLEVTDEEVRRYYDQNPAEMVRPEAVRLSQIMVRVTPSASQAERAAARQKIEAILKELRAGEDFAQLARRHSEGAEAAAGGDAGLLIRGKGPPAIEKVAFSLEPGMVSDVIESRYGLHIIKVASRRPEGPIPFEDAKNAIRARLLARGREARIRAYVDRLKEQAKVERSLPAAS